MKKLAVCIAMALVATGVSAKEWKNIRIGVDPTYAPFESKAPSGQLIGFDIDLGNALCAKMHAKCEWVENDFDGLIPALNVKKIDAIISSLSITDKRKEQIAYSDKLFNSPSRMIAKDGSGLMPTVESLKGKRVGVEQGTIQETYIKTYWQPKGVILVPYQNQDQAYADLVAGRIDASFQDEVQASIGFLKTPRGKGFAFAGASIDDKKTLGDGAGIGLRKSDDDLRTQFNAAIKAIRADGTYDKIAKKYFDFNIYGH
ncbi:ABC transporter substrate-binding protein [Robbsia sp. Bb-Pol-6]|uniref:ABC transporter substrate-binding protein n=1 Tax=Robbsia betulipollinis TaxID=2981849 RepID=A0ABT3ZM62_9BURK|nr:ABC transporter substrate-binding protein [Robbsia betulipollinis]MCY0387610.1 ABC transporter substrate-binding protein [Robbsia betulipollinis]